MNIQEKITKLLLHEAAVKSVMLCVFFLFLLNSLTGYAQNRKQVYFLHFPEERYFVSDIYSQITDSTGYSIAYCANCFNLDTMEVNMPEEKYELNNLLSYISTVFKLKYYIRKNKIIIIPQYSNNKATGIVRDFKDKMPIPYAHVWISGTNYGTVTDSIGFFSLDIPYRADIDTLFIEMSYLGYRKIHSPLELFQVVELIPEPALIDDIRIFTQQTIEYENVTYNIYDYDLVGDMTVLLVYKNKLRKSKLLLVNAENEIVDEMDISSRSLGLFSDCTGKIQLITYYRPFYIKIKDMKFVLMPLSGGDFGTQINKPCIGVSTDKKYFFYTYNRDRTKTEYSYFDLKEKKINNFFSVTDTSFLKPGLIVNPRYRGSLGDVDLGGYNNRPFLNTDKHMYNPMFFFNDTAYIFNHTGNMAEKYNKNGKFISYSDILYHQTDDWSGRILLDKTTGILYTRYFDDSGSIVYEINPTTGDLMRPIYLPFKNIQKLKAYNSNLYFLLPIEGEDDAKEFKQIKL